MRSIRYRRFGFAPPSLVLALAAGLASWWGCTYASAPVADRPADRSPRTPVVFVPGVTGASLVDTASGRAVWGTGAALIRPHDRGYGAARSLVIDAAGPEIAPGQVILDLRLFGVLRFEVYQSLVDLFVANGYHHGDLADPAPGDDFFLFAYDWRADNVDSAARLVQSLETLRRRRGEERLLVNLICQSNGAHVCRYFAKYRDLGLEAASGGEALPEDRVAVDRMILVGSSNGGSIRVLRELNRGRRYIRSVGRLFSPETLFTFVSLFQDLPIYSDDLFVDVEGTPMGVDLFDSDNWERFGWSIYSPKVQRFLGRTDLPRWFGDQADRREYLQRSLARARRFHAALEAEATGFGSTRTYLIGNQEHDTSARAVLLQQGGEWQTLFGDDPFVRRQPALYDAVVEAGDGHATVASQGWLSEQEERHLERHDVRTVASHRKIILQPETHRLLIEILAAADAPSQ